MGNKMSVIKSAFVVLISVYISTAARAPDVYDPVNFNVFPGQQFPVLSSVDTAPAEPRDGRQSVLGCLKGCTRELRVREHEIFGAGYRTIEIMNIIRLAWI